MYVYVNIMYVCKYVCILEYNSYLPRQLLNTVSVCFYVCMNPGVCMYIQYA